MDSASLPTTGLPGHRCEVLRLDWWRDGAQQVRNEYCAKEADGSWPSDRFHGWAPNPGWHFGLMRTRLYGQFTKMKPFFYPLFIRGGRFVNGYPASWQNEVRASVCKPQSICRMLSIARALLWQPRAARIVSSSLSGRWRRRFKGILSPVRLPAVARLNCH